MNLFGKHNKEKSKTWMIYIYITYIAEQYMLYIYMMIYIYTYIYIYVYLMIYVIYIYDDCLVVLKI